MTINAEARAGPYVFLQVRDTGTVIPATVIDKIFDPFFTTSKWAKAPGSGFRPRSGS